MGLNAVSPTIQKSFRQDKEMNLNLAPTIGEIIARTNARAARLRTAIEGEENKVKPSKARIKSLTAKRNELMADLKTIAEKISNG